MENPNQDESLPDLSLALGGGHANSHEEGDGNWLVSYADMMTLLVGFFVILMSFSSFDQEKMEDLKKALTVQFGGTYEVPYGKLSDKFREELKKLGLGDQVVVKQSDVGVEISFLGTVFFDTGSALMKERGLTLMAQIIPLVRAESHGFDIVIEGHTDDVPVNSSSLFRNNWELSSLRACRVLEQFVDASFEKANMIAIGYGDSKPIVPNRDANGVAILENQSQNRRVVIRLIKRNEPAIGGSPSKGA